MPALSWMCVVLFVLLWLCGCATPSSSTAKAVTSQSAAASGKREVRNEAGRPPGDGQTNPTGGGGNEKGSSEPTRYMRHVHIKAYAERVQRQIASVWTLPALPKKGKALESIVLVAIARDGNVAHFALLQGSGHTQFDDSLLRAIKQASPFPPLPEDYNGSTLEVQLRFRPRSL